MAWDIDHYEGPDDPVIAQIAPAHRSKSERFRFAKVKAHLLLHHPGCSSNQRQAIANRVCRRKWSAGTSLGKAVGIILAAYARHEMTDYDELLSRFKLERDEARLVVEPEVRDVLLALRTPPENR